jgi:hypothetical protein
MPQPTTQWIKDSGTTLDTEAGYLVDELGNFLVDETGAYLLDSLSTDGNVLPHDWDSTEELPSAWANAYEARISESSRVTVQGDTRVTVQGDTRVANTSPSNFEANTLWEAPDEPTTGWASAFEARITQLTRTTPQGDTRITVQGQTRVADTSPANSLPNTAWVEEYA